MVPRGLPRYVLVSKPAATMTISETKLGKSLREIRWRALRSQHSNATCDTTFSIHQRAACILHSVGSQTSTHALKGRRPIRISSSLPYCSTAALGDHIIDILAHRIVVAGAALVTSNNRNSSRSAMHVSSKE